MRMLSDADVQSDTARRIRALTPESRRRWGRMTSHQAVCHLNDSFRLVMNARPCAPGWRPFMRGFVKWWALNMPLPWPPNYRTIPEIDQIRGGTKPVEFEADRAELLRLLDSFVQLPHDYLFAQHPFFGALTHREWMVWGFRHTNHHLRQFGV